MKKSSTYEAAAQRARKHIQDLIPSQYNALKLQERERSLFKPGQDRARWLAKTSDRAGRQLANDNRDAYLVFYREELALLQRSTT